MAQPNNYRPYLQPVPNSATIGERIPKSVLVSHGGGSGGGKSPVDAEIKNYLDANMRAVSAENNASFARLEAKIDGIQPGATWQQNAGVLATGIVVTLGLVFGILAFASDRFDSGANSMGAVEEALDLQRELNAEQDARIDKILGALEATND